MQRAQNDSASQSISGFLSLFSLVIVKWGAAPVSSTFGFLRNKLAYMLNCVLRSEKAKAAKFVIDLLTVHRFQRHVFELSHSSA